MVSYLMSQRCSVQRGRDQAVPGLGFASRDVFQCLGLATEAIAPVRAEVCWRSATSWLEPPPPGTMLIVRKAWGLVNRLYQFIYIYIHI